jgi:hypothetical protein
MSHADTDGRLRHARHADLSGEALGSIPAAQDFAGLDAHRRRDLADRRDGAQAALAPESAGTATDVNELGIQAPAVRAFIAVGVVLSATVIADQHHV